MRLIPGPLDDTRRHPLLGILDPGDDVGSAVATGQARFLLRLDEGDRIEQPGLEELVRLLADLVASGQQPPGIVTADELLVTAGGAERIHRFPPDRISCVTGAVTGGCCLIAGDAARRVGCAELSNPGQVWADLVARLVRSGAGGRWFDTVVVSRREPRPRPAWELFERLAAGVGEFSLIADPRSGRPRVQGRSERELDVSVVLPTIGASSTGPGSGGGRFVISLLDHLLRHRSPALHEILVIVDAATPAAARAELATVAGGVGRGLVRLIEDPARDFDFSAKVNLGVAHAGGSHVLLLNDDVLPIATDWLEALLDLARVDGVDVVGATLLYDDDTIQHAGMVAVEGLVGHVAQGRPYEPLTGQPWGFDRLALGATAACLLVERERYGAVGGFSQLFPVNYNDVDFCLKVRDSGSNTAISASALLYHYESKSRQAVVADAEYHRLAARWYDRLLLDPHHPSPDVAAPEQKERR